LPSQAGPELAGALAADEANTDSLFSNFVEPQCGHFVPFHLLDRTRISLSLSHFSQ